MAFDLNSISRKRGISAPRILLYGVEGIGKSSFGAAAPSPVFIPTEDGLGNIEVDSFPLAKTYAQVEAAIATLCTQEHAFKTVVLDSADWLENMIADKMKAEHTPSELGFGRDAKIAVDLWRNLLDGFDALRNNKGMAVILIAHSKIKRFDDPVEGSYDRYMPKLEERSNSLLREWADAVLFTNYRTVVVKEDVGFKKEVKRGIGSGERLIYTSERPAYMAKNRYGMPEHIPLSWDAFVQSISTRQQPQ